MKTPIISGLLMLGLIVSCGDASSNRKTATSNPVINTPAVTEIKYTVNSGIHREKGAPILTYATEIKKTLANDLSDILYRIIPSMEKDDEGSSKSVITLSTLGRPRVECGTGSFAGVNARISDCATKNADSATWDGEKYASNAESKWKLVRRSAVGNEIWFDELSGMVWSDLITTEAGVNRFNWCRASGNIENETPTETIDCSAFAALEKICVGMVSDGIGDAIKWRLPTRNDMLQADLNGSRFVLKKESNLGLWTATIRASGAGRTEAWVYFSEEGTLAPGNLLSERQVRCIGIPSK